jgi:hypothetical protein
MTTAGLERVSNVPASNIGKANFLNIVTPIPLPTDLNSFGFPFLDAKFHA